VLKWLAMVTSFIGFKIIVKVILFVWKSENKNKIKMFENMLKFEIFLWQNGEKCLNKFYFIRYFTKHCDS
jgi:hypothetical protein